MKFIRMMFRNRIKRAAVADATSQSLPVSRYPDARHVVIVMLSDKSEQEGKKMKNA